MKIRELPNGKYMVTRWSFGTEYLGNTTKYWWMNQDSGYEWPTLEDAQEAMAKVKNPKGVVVENDWFGLSRWFRR